MSGAMVCMTRLTFKILFRQLVLTLLLVAPAVDGLADDVVTGRFLKEIKRFAEWDAKNAVPANAILFVGSSSIRFWETAAAFPGVPVINRGFGGSEISDVIFHYDRVIKPYAPAKIFLYGGDNDIAFGKNAAQVFADYRQLIDRVQRDFPAAQLIFLSIKPSRARQDKWPEMQKANGLIQEFAAANDRLGYVDLATPLFNEQGELRDVFVKDGLHLNALGYTLWTATLDPYVRAGRDEER